MKKWKVQENPRPNPIKNVTVLVAHPDDETLWAGGFILDNWAYNYFIISLCRGNDKDRAPKFKKALKILNAQGVMGNVDDGPEQHPLPAEEIERNILDLLPSSPFQLLIAHSPFGEYTRHRRHEEIGKTIISLWSKKRIMTGELWLFAYEDGHKTHAPIAIGQADRHDLLSKDTYRSKYLCPVHSGPRFR